MAFSIEEAMEIVRSYPMTMFAIDKDGVIHNCVGMIKKPSTHEVYMLGKNKLNKGCVVSFMMKDENITEEKIRIKIIDSMKSNDFFDGLDVEIERLKREKTKNKE